MFISCNARKLAPKPVDDLEGGGAPPFSNRENTKIPSLKLLKLKLTKICFIYAFDQPDSDLFVNKIWDTASFFWKNGPEEQATLNKQNLNRIKLE